MMAGMDSIANFLVVVDAYCAARDISEGRASTLILNGGGRLPAIRSGRSDIGARTLEKAMQWLSDHWPDAEAAWPERVPRPPKSLAVALAPTEGAAA